MSKKKEFPVLKGVTTEYTIPDKDIATQMYDIRAKHLRQFGDEPKAWIINAQDYMCLIEKIQTMGRWQFGYPTDFMGLPIRLKRSGPIELEVPIEHWNRYAMGRIKDE